MTDKLREQLYLDRVDHGEFTHIIDGFFNKSEMRSEREVVYHQGNFSEYGLMLTYRGDQITDVSAGPLLTTATLEKMRSDIRETLIDHQLPAVGVHVLFSRQPVEGWWRCGDIVQITPAPPEAPRPEFGFADHPFILEFRYLKSHDALINNFRRASKARELGLLIQALLKGGTHVASRDASHSWVAMPNEAGPGIKSVYAQHYYAIPGLEPDKDSFSVPVAQPLIDVVAARDYYRKRGTSMVPLQVPSSLITSVEDYVYADTRIREMAMRAFYWLNHAASVWNMSQSAAFVALIGAVEAAMPKLDGPRCPQCHKALEGPTKQFREFLEQFSPVDEQLNGARKRLYQKRSNLVHGSDILGTDTRFSWGLTQAMAEDWADFDFAWLSVRLAIVNWLHSVRHDGQTLIQ